MPTGYTADVGEGKVNNLRTFILRCARSFGALMCMRDEAMDAKLPDRIEADTEYDDRELESAERGLENFKKLSQARLRKMHKQEHLDALEDDRKHAAETALTRDRYQRMLNQVVEWRPPTDQHEGLKRFMMNQLEESIDFDCTEYKRACEISFQDWHKTKLERFRHDIDYHTKRRAKEIAYAKERNDWLQNLYRSLPEE